MANIDVRATWERLGFYHACESTWGTPITATSGWYWLRELTNANPMPSNPKNAQGFLGTGKGYNEFDYYTIGMNTMKAFSTRHPMTPFAFRDGFALYCQNNDDAGHAYWQDHAGTSIQCTKQATLLTKSAASGTNTCHIGTSCLINQVSVSIPTSGECTLGFGWIGQTAAIGDSQGVGTPTADSAEAFQGQSCTFSIMPAGGAFTAQVGFSSAEITYTNGAALAPCATAGAGLPGGAHLGRSNVTGTINCLDMDSDANQAYTSLMTALEATADGATAEIVLKWGWSADATNLIVPVVITDRGDPQDVGGALAYPFTFQYAGGEATYPIWRATCPSLTASPYYAA
jgi:hypothetical protein